MRYHQINFKYNYKLLIIPRVFWGGVLSFGMYFYVEFVFYKIRSCKKILVFIHFKYIRFLKKNVHPNSFINMLDISIKNTKAEKVYIQIFNMLGQKVAMQSSRETKNISIATSKLPVGQYFVKIEVDNQTIFKQLLK